MSWLLLLIPLGSALFGSIFYIIGRVTGKPGSKNWHRAQGVAITKPGTRLAYRARQRYRWWGPDGVARESEGAYSNNMLKKDGAPLTVLFDPQDFDRFRLDGVVESGVLFKVAGWVIFGIGVFVAVIMGIILVMLGPFPSA